MYSCYSVDASAMVKLKDMLPEDLFRQAWDEVERLVAAGKWLIFDQVAREIHGEWMRNWFARNPDAVVGFDDNFNSYLNQFMTETDALGLHMVNPDSLKDAGDPFVVALALMLEHRDLSNLSRKTCDTVCCVVSNEARRPNKVNIPRVCDHYGIACANLFDFMRHHRWQFTLTVSHPD